MRHGKEYTNEPHVPFQVQNPQKLAITKINLPQTYMYFTTTIAQVSWVGRSSAIQYTVYRHAANNFPQIICTG